MRDIEDLPSGARCVFQVLVLRSGLSLDLPQVAEAASMSVEEAQKSLDVLLQEELVWRDIGPTGRPRFAVK